MTANRDVAHDDVVQAWAMEREERTESRRLLALLTAVAVVLYVGALALVVFLAVAWSTTGDSAFVWALLVELAALAIGYAYLFRKHPNGADR